MTTLRKWLCRHGWHRWFRTARRKGGLVFSLRTCRDCSAREVYLREGRWQDVKTHQWSSGWERMLFHAAPETPIEE